MVPFIDPFLPPADAIVLQDLARDISGETEYKDDGEKAALAYVIGLSDEKSTDFQSTVFTAWDLKDIHLPTFLDRVILQPYIQWAQTVVRRKTDVVFLTHTLLYLATSVPSALYLFFHFTYAHAICHWIMTSWYCGPFSIMMHNHSHNSGVLSKQYAFFDFTIPYILQPLMGHTWNSYYYHHIKHHHCESNGPDDISSTIRYQRDSLLHFLCYVGRFLFAIWIELPLYFVRKKRYGMAVKQCISELTSYGFIYVMATRNFRATLFTLILPLIVTRIGLMVANWAQHAFIDEEDPDSNFRSSLTLIDVSVRFTRSPFMTYPLTYHLP
jgi:Fatty acid desaturase